MKLFESMKIKNKLILMVGVALAGLLYFAVSGITGRAALMGEIALLQPLSELSVKIGSVVHEIQKERGMTGAFIGTKGVKFSAELPGQRGDSDKRISDLRAMLKDFESDRYGKDFKSGLDAAIGRLDKISGMRNSVNSLNISGSEAIQYYTETVGSLLQVVANITKVSTDAGLSKMIFAYVNLLYEKEKTGIERAIIANVFGADKFSGDQYVRFVGAVSQQAAHHEVFLTLALDNQKEFYLNMVKGEDVEEAARMRKIAIDKGSAGGFGVDSAHWFNAMTGKINLIKEVEDKAGRDIEIEAAALKGRARSALVFYAGLSAALIFLSVVLVMIIVRSITGPLNIMTQSSLKIAGGNLDVNVNVNSKDELGTLANAMNQIIGRFNEMLWGIQTSAEQLASASEQLSGSATQIAKGSEEQANRASQAATASQEMNATVVEVAKNASNVAEAAKETSGLALKGSDVVAASIDSMNSLAATTNETSRNISTLGDRSQDIGKIIKVIDEIADQTNLLALNAAIEAARAGEQGRGFAVVADEVRKLAERTTKATKEIADMIRAIQDDTGRALTAMNSEVKVVEDGVKLVQDAGQSLKSIVENVERVTAMIQQIATAAEEQSTASDQINKDIETVAGITRETTGGAQQIASASQEIASLASGLQSNVTRFKLAQKDSRAHSGDKAVVRLAPGMRKVG